MCGVHMSVCAPQHTQMCVGVHVYYCVSVIYIVGLHFDNILISFCFFLFLCLEASSADRTGV